MPEGVRTSTAIDQVTEKSRFNNFPSLPVPQPLKAERKPTVVQQLLDEIDEYYGESARLRVADLTAARFNVFLRTLIPIYGQAVKHHFSFLYKTANAFTSSDSRIRHSWGD